MLKRGVRKNVFNEWSKIERVEKRPGVVKLLMLALNEVSTKRKRREWVAFYYVLSTQVTSVHSIQRTLRRSKKDYLM